MEKRFSLTPQSLNIATVGKMRKANFHGRTATPTAYMNERAQKRKVLKAKIQIFTKTKHRDVVQFEKLEIVCMPHNAGF